MLITMNVRGGPHRSPGGGGEGELTLACASTDDDGSGGGDAVQLVAQHSWRNAGLWPAN